MSTKSDIDTAYDYCLTINFSEDGREAFISAMEGDPSEGATHRLIDPTTAVREYLKRYDQMEKRNPDMSESDIHKRVIFKWMDE